MVQACLEMTSSNMNKEFFLRNYNYHFRYVNINRKIKKFEENSRDLEKILRESYKPTKIRSTISSKGKKVFEHEGIVLTITSDVLEGPLKIKKKYFTLPKKEQVKYLLFTEIISETVQYCADLASIILSLRDFKKKKLSIVDITDTYLKEWYMDFEKPDLEEFLEILNYPQLNELDREQRFYFELLYDEFQMKLKLIGAFYCFHYDNIYVPYRHGMRIFLQKDKEGAVYFFCLSKEGNFKRVDFKKNVLEQCAKISEFIFEIFEKQLALLIETKIYEKFALLEHRLVDDLIPTPINLPLIEFDPKIVNQKLDLSNEITIFHFLVNDLDSFIKLNNIQNLKIKISYSRKQKEKNIIIIDGYTNYLDSFWSLRIPREKNAFIILSCCPLAYSIETILLKLQTDPYYSRIFQEIKDSIKFFLTVEMKEKYTEPIYFEIPIRRDFDKDYLDYQIFRIAEEITLVIGFYCFKDFLNDFNFQEEEIEYLKMLIKQKIIKSIHLKNFLNKLEPEKAVFCLVDMLFFKRVLKDEEIPESLKNNLDYANLYKFLEESNNILLEITNTNINLDEILKFLNLIYDHSKFLM